MGTVIVDILQAGFFDYTAMLSGIRTSEETAASIKVLNAVLGLVESTGSSDIDFVKAVLEDVQTMIWIAERESERR